MAIKTGTNYPTQYPLAENVLHPGQWYSREEVETRLQPNQTARQVFRNWYEVTGDPTIVREQKEAASQAEHSKLVEAAMKGTSASSGKYTGSTIQAKDYGKTSTGGGNVEDNKPVNTQSGGQSTTAPRADLVAAAGSAVKEAGTLYNMDMPLPKVPDTLRQPHRDIALEAVKAYESQKPVVAAQARKSQQGLDIALQAGIEYDAALREHKDRVLSIGESAANSFAEVVNKVEGNAQIAAGNVIDGLQRIETWARDIMDRLDVNKARDITAGVHSTTEAMNQMDREMAATYGRDSDEYRQYSVGKATSLHSILQNIQTTYANNIQQLGTSFADMKAKYMTEAEMFASFERQHAGTIAKDMALAESAFDMQVSGEVASTNMLITANQENMANWIIESPVMGMDASSVISFIGSLAVEQWAADQAALAARAQAKSAEKSGKMSMWGSIAGAGMMAFGMPMMMV